MSIKEVEERIIKIAHEFSKKYGEEVLQLSENELIAYIIPHLSLEYLNIFRYYKYQMLALFLKIVKEDLNKS